MLPVIKLDINYMKPAKYDDLLTITTIMKKKPLVKIEFNFEVHNEKNELLTTGFTSLVFMDMKKSKPIKMIDCQKNSPIENSLINFSII